MMDLLVSLVLVLSWLFLLGGSFFSVTGGIGLVRLPDFYTRMHAGGVTDTLGAGLIMLGLTLQSGWSLTTAKLVIILFFLLITSPTSCHALAHSARLQGLEPITARRSDT
jgi:multicomponent Na+:H+ antiporter subunit G